ncbi:hypothetical protein [Rhizobium sp. PP-F2F-G48]|uniref:hypothetical protein n=1 Tax=Rhizobium sp. PP-F2F-G48 TaxID=2135651 RepID=UPI001FDFFF81|nr:hypothetical protein [Rhizobium sp. PP-F2F-G48]
MVEELFAFLFRVDLTRRNPCHQIVASRSDKLLLHQIHDLHGCHDVGDVAVDLQASRLVAGCLADDDGLDQITDDRHETLFCVFVGIVAGEEEQLLNSNFDTGRIELLL